MAGMAEPKLRKVETRSDVVNAVASYEVLLDGVAVGVVTSFRYQTWKMQRNGRRRTKDHVAWEADVTDSLTEDTCGYDTRADAVRAVTRQREKEAAAGK